MENMDRRTFLKGGAGLAAGAALLGAAGCAPSTPAANDALASTAAGELRPTSRRATSSSASWNASPLRNLPPRKPTTSSWWGPAAPACPPCSPPWRRARRWPASRRRPRSRPTATAGSFVVKAHSNPAGHRAVAQRLARLNDWRINNELFNYYVEYAEEAVPWVISQGRSVGIEPIEFLTDSSIRYDDGGVVAVCDATQASNQDLMVALAQKAARAAPRSTTRPPACSWSRRRTAP